MLFAAVNWVDLPPILVLMIAIGFTVYCLVDLTRVSSVRHLPKWAWALICLVAEPLGGIVYLILGRGDRG